MNKDELFETLQAEEESTDFIRINPDSRQANVLEPQMILGVRTDKNTERKHFIISRIVGDNVDLTKYTLYILWENAGGTLGRYIVNDVKVSGNDITFSWLIDNTVTVYVGKIHFTLCATKVDSAGKLTNEWNTTLATGTVLEGLEVDYPVIEQPEKDTIAQLLQIVRQTSADAVKDVTAEGDKQVKRVQETGSELRVDVNKNKENIIKLAIKPTVSGNPIITKDSADFPVISLELGGSTEQVQTTGKNLFNGGEVTASQTYNDIFPAFDKYISIAELPPKTIFTTNITTNNYNDSNVRLSLFSQDKSLLKFLKGTNATRTNPESVYVLDKAQILSENPTAVFVRLIVRIQDGGSTYKTMICDESKGTEYEPYTGGLPSPSPNYPQEIVMGEWDTITDTGKNLWNGKFLTGYYNFNGFYDTSSPSRICTEPILWRCGGVINILFHAMQKTKCAYITWKNEVVVERVTDFDEQNTPIKIDMSNADSFAVFFYEVDENLVKKEEVNLQLSPYASEKTETYETFKGFTKTLSNKIQLSEWDKIKFVNGLWKKENFTGKVLLSSLDFYPYKMAPGTFQTKDITDNLMTFDQKSYCDNFRFLTMSWDKGIPFVYCGHEALHNFYFTTDNPLMTAEEFKQFLVTHDGYLYYLKETPTYETLPQEAQALLNKIVTFYPNTVLSTNEGITLNLRYVADTKNYTDNKNKALLDRIAELEQAIIK